MKGIDVLVFDAYGTLFDVNSISQAVEAVFPGKGTTLSKLWRTKQIEYTWLLSLVGRYLNFEEVTRRALRYTAKAMHVDLNAEIERELLFAYNQLKPFPETVEALTTLYKRYPLAILSNGTTHMLEAVTSHSGIRNLFQLILSVDSVRIYKPSPRVYSLVMEAFDVDRRSVGFVSSNAWDIAGAKAFGFSTFWINRAGQTEEALDLNADFILTDLQDLERLLRSKT